MESSGSPYPKSAAVVGNVIANNNQAVTSVTKVTLGDLSSLQLLLGNVLKALTTLSEDVKVLRGDVDSITTATAKASMDAAHIRRTLTEGYPSRSDVDHIVASMQEQHEALAMRVAEHQATSSRDREILVHRIAALEVQQKLERASFVDLEERIVKVENYMSRDGILLATRVEELSEQQHKQETDAIAKVSHLQQRVSATERMLETQFQEQCNITGSIVGRVDQTEHLIQHLEQMMDRDRTSLTGSIQRVSAELARNEGIQAHVSASLAKLVDAAMDRKLSELQVDLERQDTANSKKLQHVSTLIDVRLEGLKEHVAALSNELSDAKSEVSVFSSTLAQHQNKMNESIAQVEEQLQQTNAHAEERWQRQKAAQLERAQDTTNQVNAITDDLIKAVQLGQQETERKVKSLLQNALEKHDGVVMEQLLVQQKDQSERVHSELDALRQQLEETAGFCRLRLSEQSSQFRSLSQLLFIDLDRTPSDPADRLRYLRTLPWCASNAASAHTATPVLLETHHTHHQSLPHQQHMSYSGVGITTNSSQHHHPLFSMSSNTTQHNTTTAVAHQTMSTAAHGGNASHQQSADRSIVSQTLGIEVRSASAMKGLLGSNNSAHHEGVEVLNVVVDGAAYLSGVRVGDVIVAVGDHVVTDSTQFAEALRLEASLGKETPRLWLRRDGPSTPERRFFA